MSKQYGFAYLLNNEPPESERFNYLLSLLGQSRELANRLIDLTKQRYPNHTERWVLEKTIRDLERDRQ